jgi:hypothetical protein
MEKSTRRTWLSILIASVIIVGILAVAAVGGTAYFFYRHINAQNASRESAEEQFAAARARFNGQKPLIEIRRGDDPIVHHELLAEAHSDVKIEALRVLAYDPDENKLVRVSIPFWLIRLMPGKHFSFLNDNGIDFDNDRIRLTARDLERLGPSLILDEQDRQGAYVIVWTE